MGVVIMKIPPAIVVVKEATGDLSYVHVGEAHASLRWGGELVSVTIGKTSCRNSAAILVSIDMDNVAAADVTIRAGDLCKVVHRGGQVEVTDQVGVIKITMPEYYASDDGEAVMYHDFRIEVQRDAFDKENVILTIHVDGLGKAEVVVKGGWA